MAEIIRPAEPADVEHIALWTQHTFEWGDYVADALPRWIEDEDAMPVVAEVDGAVVALASIVMMSEREAWGQGMRVHPDHRRGGLAVRVTEHLWAWARERGARVTRLTVEDWNEAARGQAAKMQFKPVSDWVMAERGVGASSPTPVGNGGKRVPAPEAVRPSHSAEAEPAIMSWSTGPLAHAARGLFPPDGWRWRQLHPEDLIEAARQRTLWEGRPGWAIARVDAETFSVRWIETSESDARAMVHALIDRAADLGVDRLQVFCPAVDWLVQALRYFGAEIHPMKVYARVLDP